MLCAAEGAFAEQTRWESLTAGPTCESFAGKRRHSDEVVTRLVSPSATSVEAALAGE